MIRISWESSIGYHWDIWLFYENWRKILQVGNINILIRSLIRWHFWMAQHLKIWRWVFQPMTCHILGLNISEHPYSFLSDDFSVRMLAGMIKGEHVLFFLNVAMENHHVQNIRTKSALVHIENCWITRCKSNEAEGWDTSVRSQYVRISRRLNKAICVLTYIQLFNI